MIEEDIGKSRQMDIALGTDILTVLTQSIAVSVYRMCAGVWKD